MGKEQVKNSKYTTTYTTSNKTSYFPKFTSLLLLIPTHTAYFLTQLTLLKTKLRQIPIWGFYTHFKRCHNKYWIFPILLFSKLSDQHTYTHFKILEATFPTATALPGGMTPYHLHFISQKDLWPTARACPHLYPHTQIQQDSTCEILVLPSFSLLLITCHLLWMSSCEEKAKRIVLHSH